MAKGQLNLFILSFVIFLALVPSSIARSSFELGSNEVKVSKILAEGETETYNVNIVDGIVGISYFVRSNEPSMCWLRVYNPSGKKIHSKNYGDLFSRFLGRSEAELIENISSGQYTLDIMSPSYGTCDYELYLIGLTENKLLSNPESEVYKTNQELMKKEETINSLRSNHKII